IGLGIGFGGLSSRDALGQTTTDSAMAYTARVGFGLRPGLILMWDLEGSVVTDPRRTVSQTASLAALQIFLGNRLFLKAGFGLAEVVQYDAVSNWGGAAMAGLGVEVIQGWHWSLDIEATVTGARYTYSTGNETWTNWSL